MVNVFGFYNICSGSDFVCFVFAHPNVLHADQLFPQ